MVVRSHSLFSVLGGRLEKRYGHLVHADFEVLQGETVHVAAREPAGDLVPLEPNEEVLEVHLVATQAILQVFDLHEIAVVHAGAQTVQAGGNARHGDEADRVVVTRKGLEEISLLEQIPEHGEGELVVAGNVQQGLHLGALLVFRLLGGRQTSLLKFLIEAVASLFCVPSLLF